MVIPGCFCTQLARLYLPFVQSKNIPINALPLKRVLAFYHSRLLFSLTFPSSKLDPSSASLNLRNV